MIIKRHADDYLLTSQNKKIYGVELKEDDPTAEEMERAMAALHEVTFDILTPFVGHESMECALEELLDNDKMYKLTDDLVCALQVILKHYSEDFGIKENNC